MTVWHRSASAVILIVSETKREEWGFPNKQMKMFYDYKLYTITNEHAHAALWHTSDQIITFSHSVM